MKALPHLIALVILLPVISLASDIAVPRLIDDDGPTQGKQPLDLKEIWRVGGEDEDVIFGRITDVKRHTDGNVYVLDNQICQVVVISPEGEHLRDLSRQGDGPGELRQPMGLIFLSDEVLGVGMGFPGKLVTMALDGTPIGTHYPIGEPADGNVGVMISINYAGGVLAATGGRLAFAGPDDSHTRRFMAVGDASMKEFHDILERETPLDPTGRNFVENKNYYFDRSWTMDAQGRLYVPMERDAYEVSVFDKTGVPLLVFGRTYEPRKRTQAEKDEVSPVINVGGDPGNRDWDIADHDGAIARVQVNPDDGTVWVLTPHGINDQPDGILESWDVFAAGGEFLKQVPIPLGQEMNDGTSYLVGGRLLVVVKGTASVFSGDQDSEDEEEAEVEPLEVICYEIR